MKIEKRTAAARRCRLEYPVFSDGEIDVSMMNSFSEKLVKAILAKCGGSARYRLTYSLSEVKDGVGVSFLFEVLDGRDVLRFERLRILWKRGYIKKFGRN